MTTKRCGLTVPPDQVTLDHVIPLVQGGSHSRDNIRVACRFCNTSKGGRTPEQYFARFPWRRQPVA